MSSLWNSENNIFLVSGRSPCSEVERFIPDLLRGCTSVHPAVLLHVRHRQLASECLAPPPQLKDKTCGKVSASYLKVCVYKKRIKLDNFLPH